MYRKLIKNDLLKSKFTSTITLLFVVAAALLVSLAVLLMVNLSGTIETLMSQGKTSHFLQMHSGELNKERLEGFAAQNQLVEAYQALEFVNIENSEIIINGKPLLGNIQDNGFSIQSETFDYLLDLEGQKIEVRQGEVYVPICYMKDGSVKIGDLVRIGETMLTVTGFLRDSQMNALLASSKRFLVNEEDFKEIRMFGSIEYLIEFRIKDINRLGEFENAYSAAQLEANGPTITYPLFKMMNALSDGMIIAVILLISVLVVVVALMCIRFILLAKIEEDYKEIGVMKAIGISLGEIRKIYLAKYAAIVATGCGTGYLIAFGAKERLLEDIRLSMGVSDKGDMAWSVSAIGVVVIGIIMMLYVNGILKRFKKISPAEAIRFGIIQEQAKEQDVMRLSQNKLLSTSVFLGIKDVLCRKKLYVTMLLVIILMMFIMLVPQNIYQTLSSKEFVNFMGVGQCDMRVDLQQIPQITEKAEEMAKALASDNTVSKYVVLTTKTFTVHLEDGTEQRMKIEFGDYSVFPIEYAKGRAPEAEDEIALSAIQAEALGKKMGDILRVSVEGAEKRLKVCGIYSDITNGGKTAKAVFKTQTAEVMWSIICATFQESQLTTDKVLEYQEKYNFAKVSSIEAYMAQTLGGMRTAIQTASYMAGVIALLLSGLITTLFMKMIVAKDRYEIAILKAIGFTESEVGVQYMSRILSTAVIGIIAGTVLASTLGEYLAGLAIASFGVTTFKFQIVPLMVYVVCPLMMIGSVASAAMFGITGISTIKIWENIKE